MDITLQQLTELRACAAGLGWFKNQTHTDLRQICKALLADGKFYWANWLVTHLMDRRQRVEYAIFGAESVLHIFENKYPEDLRPRRAVEAARAYLDGKKPAAADADAAYADAAYAAADALKKSIIDFGSNLILEKREERQ